MVIAQKKNNVTKGKLIFFFKKRHIYENKPGKPAVEKDPEGNITSYEITEQVSLTEGHTTEYVPFRGKNWICHLKCKMKAGSSYSNYATVIHALDNVLSGSSGDSDRWEGFIVRYEGVTSLTRYPRLVIGSSKYIIVASTSSLTLDLTFEYKDKVLTVTNNGSQIFSGAMNISRNDITIWLGSDSGGGNKCAMDIIEFSVKDV